MLVIFSGGSGVGKNTVINEMLKTDKFVLMPTYTTRGQRPNEKPGEPYYYISEEEFEKKIKSGELFEHNIVHGNYYGASRKLFEEKRAGGKILLKDIDVEGTQNLVKRIGDADKVVTIFLQVESKDVLVKRLTERGETEIEKRLSRYEMEQEFKTSYDYIITNNDLYETLDICNGIINFELSGGVAATKDDIDVEKVEEMVKLLEKANGEIPPVDVRVTENGVYVVNGQERYLASLKSGIKLSKNVVTE